MQDQTHWNILLSDQVDKKTFIENLLSGQAKAELSILNGLKGILFSDIAIQKFIAREEQYDSVEAANPELNLKLRTFSSGEQKKEFLQYCLNQQPDYIIFDNPFDHLDQVSRTVLATSLEELSNSITIIQLVNRKTDFLSFIKNKVQIRDNSFTFNPISNQDNKTRKITSRIPEPLIPFETSENILVKMDGISVHYNERKIVDRIFWTIKQGEFWQLIGPNGSGKSTLLSMITGDNPKGYGQELYLFGQKKGSGESVWDIKKRIGIFSTAMTELFRRSQTVEEMILSGFFDSIGLYIQPTVLQKQIVTQWLEVIEMSSLKNKRFHSLSLGQQRVVLIVRAILKHPPLVILDEPIEGLDDENVALLIQLINLLQQETNMTILYVSHRIEPTLAPNAIFELTPAQSGSTGKVKFHSDYQ